MTKVRKLLALALAMALVVSLAGCGGGKKSETEAPTEKKTEAVTEKKTEAPTEAAAETEAPAEVETEAPTEAEVTPAETEAPAEVETEAPTEAEVTPAEVTAEPETEPETTAAEIVAEAESEVMSEAAAITAAEAAIAEAETEAPETEAVTEAETEAPETEAVTEAETEAPETEAVTEAETEAPETEAVTEAETEAPETEAVTEAETEAPETEAVTEAETEAPAEVETEAPTEAESADITPAEVVATEAKEPLDFAELDEMDYDEACETIYDYVLGDFGAAYDEAKQETGDMRMAKMAIAEAKLLESGAFLPIYTQGGNYAMSRVVPRTNAATTLWGLDEYRYHTLLVTNELITAEDRTNLLTLWNEADTADEYIEEAELYLTGKGYTFADTYVEASPYNVNIWDTIATSYTSDSMFISGTYDNLLEYDAKGVQQPGLAESYEVSEDGTVYTFHIRKGVKWVDQQGTEIGEVTADDWVASMEHLLDNADALGYLLTNTDGCGLLNFTAYLNGEITDYTQIGVKAIDDYTLEYTLEAPFAPFTTMLGYGVFAPLNRDFYRSQGGTFGCEGETYTPGDFGKTPANIAYCGPFLITNYTEQNTTRYEANPTYWNADKMNIHSMEYTYNDGSDVLRAYNEGRDGVTSGCGINSSALELMKTEKPEGEDKTYFDLYAYVSSGTGTTYCGWWNVNRGIWANYDNPDVGVSPKTEDDIARYRAAILNQHFRLALSMAFDKGSYNAISVGDELKLARLRNSYTPATFQFLGEETTVSINGTDTTFPAGTAYGVIEQAQLDADGVSITVWDPNGDSGAGSGDGFDGWFDADNAKAELEQAIEELSAQGVEITEENPIYIDYPYGSYSEISTNMANVVKKSIEGALDGKVIVNLIAFEKDTDEEAATYRFSAGNEGNFDLSTGSGWGPDYGDAQSYLDTIQMYGYMCKNLGLF